MTPSARKAGTEIRTWTPSDVKRKPPPHLLAVVIQCGLTYWFAAGGTEPGHVVPLLIESDYAVERQSDQAEAVLEQRRIEAEEIAILPSEASFRPFINTSLHLAIAHVSPREERNLRERQFVPIDCDRVHMHADANMIFSLLAQHNTRTLTA